MPGTDCVGPGAPGQQWLPGRGQAGCWHWWEPLLHPHCLQGLLCISLQGTPPSPYKASLWQELSSFLSVNIQPLFTECLPCAGLGKGWAHVRLYVQIKVTLIARNAIIFWTKKNRKPTCICTYNLHHSSCCNERRALFSKGKALCKCSRSHPHLLSDLTSGISSLCLISFILSPYLRWKQMCSGISTLKKQK